MSRRASSVLGIPSDRLASDVSRGGSSGIRTPRISLEWAIISNDLVCWRCDVYPDNFVVGHTAPLALRAAEEPSAPARQAIGLLAGASLPHRLTDRGDERSGREQGCRGSQLDHIRFRQQLCNERLQPSGRPTDRGQIGRRRHRDRAADDPRPGGQGPQGGLYIFTAGWTKDFTPPELENPAISPTRELLGEFGIPMSIRTGPPGLPQVKDLATRFPQDNIILDRPGRPDVLDGPPCANAESLFQMADLPNIYLKLTPRIVKKEKASAETFVPKVASIFGVHRMDRGSNFPSSPGTLADIPPASVARTRAGPLERPYRRPGPRRQIDRPSTKFGEIA